VDVSNCGFLQVGRYHQREHLKKAVSGETDGGDSLPQQGSDGQQVLREALAYGKKKREAGAKDGAMLVMTESRKTEKYSRQEESYLKGTKGILPAQNGPPYTTALPYSGVLLIREVIPRWGRSGKWTKI